MSKRCAVIEPSGTVVNVILANPRFDPGSDCTLCESETASPGDRWDGRKFFAPRQPPAPPPPTAEEKLARAGLTVADLRALLGL